MILILYQSIIYCKGN
uniref:Uncharacterized protein n=1 Tax=Arundo donax TaxID=35708 RepID=A0A0A9AE82_ARUDO